MVQFVHAAVWLPAFVSYNVFVLSLNRPMMVTAPRMHSELYNKAGARRSLDGRQAVYLTGPIDHACAADCAPILGLVSLTD